MPSFAKEQEVHCNAIFAEGNLDSYINFLRVSYEAGRLNKKALKYKAAALKRSLNSDVKAHCLGIQEARQFAALINSL